MFTDIPCVHTSVAIQFMQRTLEDYIPIYFSLEKFEECYQHVIFTTNALICGCSLQTELDDVLPPDYRCRTERPKKRGLEINPRKRMVQKR